MQRHTVAWLWEGKSEYLLSPVNLSSFSDDTSQNTQSLCVLLPREAAATMSRRFKCKTLGEKKKKKRW